MLGLSELEKMYNTLYPKICYSYDEALHHSKLGTETETISFSKIKIIAVIENRKDIDFNKPSTYFDSLVYLASKGIAIASHLSTKNIFILWNHICITKLYYHINLKSWVCDLHKNKSNVLKLYGIKFKTPLSFPYTLDKRETKFFSSYYNMNKESWMALEDYKYKLKTGY